MKLFAYEHPSGPVHEVEVTLGDTVHGGVRLQPRTPRRRVDGGDEAPRHHRPVATTPRARGRAVSRGFWTEPHRTRPPRRPRRKRAQVLQLKSKIEQAMPYTKVIEAKKQHLSFRGKKLDDDAATLEAIGVAPDYTLRAQSVTVSDK